MDVLISSQTDTEAAPVFFAIAPNGVVSSGDTPGEALDALLAHAPNTATESPDELLPLLFVVRAGKGDPFFSDAQNARLQTLQQAKKRFITRRGAGVGRFAAGRNSRKR